MEIGSSTILVTGGATGIGFALAERFVARGAKVIVCGRREDALREAKEKVSSIETLVCDVGNELDREDLAKRIASDFPDTNVLVNNAGIQRRARFAQDEAPWSERKQEIAINFEAPIHLTSLLLPHLKTKAKAAVVNVTSGLAFAPGVFAPIYCATKAAVHSFSVALRHDLAKLAPPIEVIEIVPPAVNTDLGGKGLHTQGVPVGEFADAMIKALEEGKVEMGYGFSEKSRNASRAELDAISARMAGG